MTAATNNHGTVVALVEPLMPQAAIESGKDRLNIGLNSGFVGLMAVQLTLTGFRRHDNLSGRLKMPKIHLLAVTVTDSSA